jgi:hypothetical protein
MQEKYFVNAHNFSKLFEIIYDKFISIAELHDFPQSNIGLSKFLGHEHDGRVRAWKGGQWPNAHDCWIIHKKLDIPLQFILTGQYKEETLRQNTPESAPDQKRETEEFLRQRIADLENTLAAMQKTISTQDDMLNMYKERDKFPTASDAAIPTSAADVRMSQPTSK